MGPTFILFNVAKCQCLHYLSGFDLLCIFVYIHIVSHLASIVDQRPFKILKVSKGKGFSITLKQNVNPKLRRTLSAQGLVSS